MAERKNGAQLIAAERQRQIAKEGWDFSHDDEHTDGELAQAAACYALWSRRRRYTYGYIPFRWPWEPEAWKPKGRLRDLVRAGALIAAEIDRLQRAGEDDAD